MAQVIAVDGHDSSGKTTIGRGLARALGATFTSPYRAGSGARIVAAWRSGDIAESRALAQRELEDFDARIRATDETYVCDRYLLSALALGGDWTPLAYPARHLFCRVDLPRVIEREAARGVHFSETEVEEQRWLLARYEALRREWDVDVVDSVYLDVPQALARALTIVRSWDGWG